MPKKNTKKPLVSIVMSTYNDSRFLRKAIDGVLAQTLQNWEFIILNDASTDGTEKIIEEYQKRDKRIVAINNKQNLGLTKNLNKGIDLAKGEYIARLDGDDYWTEKTKLQQQSDFMQAHPKCGIVGCFAHAVNLLDKRLFDIEYPCIDKKIRKIMLQHGPFVHSSVLMRKTVLVKIGKYNEAHNYSEDYDLYLNLGTVSQLHNIPRYMVNYRINPLGISHTKYRAQHNEVIKIIVKYRKQYPEFLAGFLMWNLRKFYPVWFRGALSKKIKNKLTFLKVPFSITE